MIRKMILFLLFFQNIHAELPKYIPLGGACGTALMLRTLNLRQEAYPFDWMISPFESLYMALDDDFEHFFESLRLRSDNQGVIDSYGFEFTHDLPTIASSAVDTLNVDFIGNNFLHPSWEAAVPFAWEKFQRRINRFRAACSGDDKVFFIRTEYITKEQAIALCNLIEKKYPTLDFVLIIIAMGSGDYKQPWGLDKVRTCYASYDDSERCKAFLDAVVREFGKSNKRTVEIGVE